MTLRLVERPLSGNCWKVRLTMVELDHSWTSITPEMLAPEEFAAISRRGRVPVLLEEGQPPLEESAAILVRLARGSHLMPASRYHQILSWLIWEQAELCKPLALPRLYHRRGETAIRAEEIHQLQRAAQEALGFLDIWLSVRPYLTGAEFSVADLACHAYVRLAPEGGLSLEPFGHVLDWVDRILERPASKSEPLSAS